MGSRVGKVRIKYYIYLEKEQMRCTVRKDNLGYNQESHLEICRVGGTGKKAVLLLMLCVDGYKYKVKRRRAKEERPWERHRNKKGV